MVSKTARGASDVSVGEGLGRRALLRRAVMGGSAAFASFLASPLATAAAGQTPKEQAAQTAVDRATRGMPVPKIKDVSFIDAFSVVKVTTDQPGLYGYGDAGVPARSKLVKAALLEYLKPLVIGRATDRIEETWQFLYLSSYYKNDHVQNAAVAGICDALWDIKGRQAGMPVYQLVGGKFRDAAEVYMHILARQYDPQLVVETAKRLVAEQKARNLQIDVYQRDAEVKALDGGASFDRELTMSRCLKAFEAFRKELPANIRLGVDVHSMLDTADALQFAKDAEQFKPWYWVEDIIPPEHQDYLRLIRGQTSVPLSFGELWNNPSEWRPVVEGRLTDFARNHLSHMGGFTAGRKFAAYAENFEVKFGWHAAGNSPVGHMSRLTLDVTCSNFGIHEHFPLSNQIMQIFQGVHEVRDGYAWVSDKPGWGIEIDEAAAAKLPPPVENDRRIRLPDGSYVTGV